MCAQKKSDPPGQITADDVAVLAGVSRWTVSRAFKPEASISEKNRQKVLAAADRLGYVPDLLAASLASDRSNLVALLVDDFANPHKLVMLDHLTRTLRRGGWDTLLVNTGDEGDASTALLNASQRRVDAAVLIGVRFNERALSTAQGARRVRKLILFARFSESADTLSVCCDDGAAMTTIADYVIGRGYARPHFLAGPQTRSAHLMRKETFLKRWQDAKGVAPGCTWVDVYDPQLAYGHVSALLSGMAPGTRPDILVCENDALAMGALDAIRYELGLSVPGDIAVIGFDDVPQAASPHYRLTTYRQPLDQLSDGLIEILRGGADTTAYAGYVGEMVIRESA